MRFADMMGSEDEQSPEPPAPPVRPAPPVPATDSETVGTGGAVEVGTPVASVATIEDVARSAMTDVAATEPGETRVADFTPYSDDLLPHRR